MERLERLERVFCNADDFYVMLCLGPTPQGTLTNLGDDADTAAAICGQLAGALYGESGIPKKWLDRLVMREETLADRLYDCQRMKKA